VCLPLCKGFFVVAVNCCVYSRNRCKFLRILTLLILLVKGPVHGEKCVNMCIVKSYFLVLFWTSLFLCILYVVYFLRLQLFFEVFIANDCFMF
jgi:hypothetical protein